MVIVAQRYNKELEVETEFDEEQELELTILNNMGIGNDTSIWLNKKEVENLIKHLQNVLQTNK